MFECVLLASARSGYNLLLLLLILLLLTLPKGVIRDVDSAAAVPAAAPPSNDVLQPIDVRAPTAAAAAAAAAAVNLTTYLLNILRAAYIRKIKCLYCMVQGSLFGFESGWKKWVRVQGLVRDCGRVQQRCRHAERGQDVAARQGLGHHAAVILLTVTHHRVRAAACSSCISTS